jgi:hypothetical protein
MAFIIEVACLYLWLPEILTVKSPGDAQTTGATEAYAENVDEFIHHPSRNLQSHSISFILKPAAIIRQ